MKVAYTLWLLFAAQVCFAQNKMEVMDDSIASRFVIIGDAGDPGGIKDGKALVIDAVRKMIPLNKKTTVLFMGDNLYSNGLPCEGDVCYLPGVAALDTQAYLVKGTDATAYFMPGNHDWANGKPEGYDNILRQATYINSIAANIKFLPEDGCPGPVEVKVSKDVVMIIMDSEWWLLRSGKPGIESDCGFKTEDEVLEGIKDILSNNTDKLIVFACHHPFKSTGVHSGYYGIKQHIFPFTDINKNLYIPLPFIGSIYPISRGVFGSTQDMKYPLYANMISKVEEVLKGHPYVLHVAGHEHNLQLMNDSNYHYLISGGGCKSQRVGHSKKTKYAAAKMGYAVVDISRNKNVIATFYEVDSKTGEAKKAYSESIIDFSKLPELAKDTVTHHELAYEDSVTLPINAKYADASGFKRLMMGNNYRTEWATPVKMKVFKLKKEHGGFKIEGLGGGKQSRSLHLKDANGMKWTLRSLNKDPAMAIPQNFRSTFAADVVQDMISAANPYGALVVPPLASALGVPHATPTYFVVPDDYAFGKYRPLFANTVCMLEEQNPSMFGEKTKSTPKIFNKLRDKEKQKIDERMLLKARLLDFLIADYDRHYDQWKWGTKEENGNKVYYAVPNDRDQALFHSDGLVMKYATWRRLPFLKGFRSDIPRPTWMGYVARYFDRTYLTELDQKDWEISLAEFKRDLTDSVISASVKNLPPEIAKMDSADIVSKLKSRRDLLPEKGIIYYKFISKRVNILGTNTDEVFHVSKNENGLKVDVYTKPDGDDSSMLKYSRTFDPKITKEVRMYGFNGDDKFLVDKEVRSGIKLRMIGGQGTDTFDIKGNVPSHIYDFKKESNVLLERHRTRDRMSLDPTINNYNDKEENYTVWRFPHLQMGYNPEDGFMAGIGVFARTFNFRRLPFSTDQRLTSLFSFANNAYQFRYRGEFLDLFHKTDIVADGSYINPTLNNFFGFGNESVKIKGTDIHYYRVRFTEAQATILLRKRYFRNLISIGVGPSVYFYDNKFNKDDRDRILEKPAALGLDSASVYSQKGYAGGKATIVIDNLNAELFPTRGVNWTTDFTAMGDLNKNSNSITKLESNMTVYASLSEPARVVAVLKIGGGHIFSDKFEYFQALTLGAHNYLRGFRKDRFSGSSMAYADVELRVKLFDVKSYIFPGALGIVGFNDFGRVWMANENSNRWHDAYGGGLYYTPFNMVIISATTAFSGEESLFNFTVGAKLNLTF